MKRVPVGVLEYDAVAGALHGELTADGTAIKAVRARSADEAERACKAAVLDLGYSPPVRVYKAADGRFVVVASDSRLAADEREGYVHIGHVRPQPGGGFGGVVNGPQSSGSVEIAGETPFEATDRGLVVARDLGWQFPCAEGPDTADSFELTGIEPELPGRRTTT